MNPFACSHYLSHYAEVTQKDADFFLISPSFRSAEMLFLYLPWVSASCKTSILAFGLYIQVLTVEGGTDKWTIVFLWRCPHFIRNVVRFKSTSVCEQFFYFKMLSSCCFLLKSTLVSLQNICVSTQSCVFQWNVVDDYKTLSLSRLSGSA